ncbi:MAG: dihydrofolate reductase family protein [Aggregatilineales bacterium]
MSKVIIDITMSLDGYVTAPNDGMGNGLGDGGIILHDWVFDAKTPDDEKFLSGDAIQALGACILGRRTFDIAEGVWGDNPPFGANEVFVLTHRPHETLIRGATTFIFVTDGMESALENAMASAKGKNVSLMGADVSQQYLKAGLVDEIQLHVANILLGGGRPLFANIGAEFIKLERLQVVPTPSTTHIRYQVVKN